jgi:restriction system protein
MAIPDYQSLMLPVLLGSADGEVRVGDIVDRLAEQLGLTAEERANCFHPASRQFSVIVFIGLRPTLARRASSK